MKKVISVLSLTLLLCSCEKPLKPGSVRNNYPIDRVFHFEHENHQYIMFTIKYPTRYGGIVHDPNCKCHE